VIEPLVLARAVHFAATALAAGTAAYLVLVAEPVLRLDNVAAAKFRRSARWLVWSGLAIAIVSGVMWLIWLASDIFGASLINVCAHGGVWSVLEQTRFGLVWMVRLGLALLLGAAVLAPAAGWLQLAAGAGLIGSLALVGHAGATPGAHVELASDVLHLVAAAIWIGALPALVICLRQGRGTAADAARRFSFLGIAGVGTLLATGIINSWNLLSGPRDLVLTSYGRIVLLKIGLFAAMVGVATVNRYRLTPRLAAPSAVRALERNSLAETALALVAFMFVGMLGTMAPPIHDHVHIPTEQIPSDAAFVHIHELPAMADVTIEPGRAGPARVRILLMREDFSIYPAKAVTLVLSPKADIGAARISRSGVRKSDQAWHVDDLEIPTPGVWNVTLTVDSGTGSPIVLDAPIVIDAGQTNVPIAK